MREVFTMCSAATQFLVAIDGKRACDYQGTVVYHHGGAAWAFGDVLELLSIIKMAIETQTSLQGTHRSRTWAKDADQSEKRFIMTDQTPERGREATFLIHVQYNQNTTWQGTVQWLESGERQSFRSALELIQLIEQVVGAVRPQDVGE